MNSTSGEVETQKPKLLGFLILLILAGGAAVYAVFFGGDDGHAPLTAHVDDWIGWARVDITDAGILAVAVIVALIAIIGMVVALAGGGKSAAQKRRESTRYDDPFDGTGMAETVAPAAPIDAQTLTPAKGDARGGSLKFEAPAETAVPVIAEPAAAIHEITSLEPAVFHDNASDSFLSQVPVTSEPQTEPVTAVFEPEAALSDTHGLHVRSGADVVPIRPDISNPALTASQATVAHDPVEAALLADTPSVIQAAPQSDMNAVIASAMSFIGETVAAPAAQAVPVAPAPVAPAVEAVAAPATTSVDDQAEIRQAVQTALSVWPDSTRGIAAGEVGGRIAHLY